MRGPQHPPRESFSPEKGACLEPPRLRRLGALFASPTCEPPPSSREFGRLIPIYLRIVIARLIYIEESFELFELL